jgi:hypothetical protein
LDGWIRVVDEIEEKRANSKCPDPDDGPMGTWEWMLYQGYYVYDDPKRTSPAPAPRVWDTNSGAPRPKFPQEREPPIKEMNHGMVGIFKTTKAAGADVSEWNADLHAFQENITKFERDQVERVAEEAKRVEGNKKTKNMFAAILEKLRNKM